MTAQVFRFYDKKTKDPKNYQFSIVASDEMAQYVVPYGRPDIAGTWNPSRVSMFIEESVRNNEPLPTNPAEWATLLRYSIKYYLFFDGETSFSYDLLLEDEQKYADDTFKKYKDTSGSESI
jgi:hypothetical protein